jgi:hypothetical protein
MRTALLISALLAAPAIADPPYDDKEQYPNEEQVWPNDHIDAQRSNFDTLQWHQLAAAANPRDGRLVMPFAPFMSMQNLRIQGTHGAPVVTYVDIRYDNRVQRATVNRRLLRGQAIDIPLDKYRDVRSIVIHTDQFTRGGYSVWGN